MLTKDKRKDAIIFGVGVCLIFAWVAVLCFYHLGESGVANWDEARHMVNAYEMLQSKNWWVTTYRYDVDYYNYKPPFSIWMIVLWFRVFGVSCFSARFYSAVAMCLIFLIVVFWSRKEFGYRAALISGILFTASVDLYFFHMARSADADALYMLMIVCALYCLYDTEKHPWLICGCAFFFSMAFMAKCLHMAVGLVILLAYFPRICKKLQWKHYLAAVLAGIMPTGIWVIVRYSFDGFAFFGGMLGIEVIDRVEKAKNYLGYTKYIFAKPWIDLTLVAVVIALIVVCRSRKPGDQEQKRLWKRMVGHPLYLFILWLLIPFLAYSMSGESIEWYCYICFIPFVILSGYWLEKVFFEVKGKWWIKVVCGCLVLGSLGCAWTKAWNNLRTLEYVNNVDLRQDLQTLIERNPEVAGRKVYIENSRNEYKEQNVWEQNNVFDAYATGDFEVTDGGVPLFLESTDDSVLLILSKDLMATYYDCIAGHVILVDGEDYLIFCKQKY